jgi:hypothetical protein
MSNLRAEGVIEALTKDGKGFLINGEWYKCFTPAMMKAARGDFVSFSYKAVEKDGRTYNNVSGVVSGSGDTSTVPNSGTVSRVSGAAAPVQRDPLMLPVLLTRERAIIRQSSLAQAVNYAGGDSRTVEDIIAIAREFEAYASGDADVEAAKAALSNEDLDGAN